ncbi:MAG: PqiC family protein [Puniceicoccales bacterium]|nr:PqiC family protein [Puniceicoccales bacterium]
MSKFYALGLDKDYSHERCSSVGNECRVICLSVESIPAYSDMSQIVKLRGSCEVVQSEFHRWAEPIKYSITRSLLHHLSSAFGGKYILVPMSESSAAKACEYKICVGFTNFIFAENNSELLLSADVSIFKRDKLVTVCEYSDRFSVGEVEYEGIVNGMDWELKILGEFIARCIDGNCVKSIAKTSTPNEVSAGKTNSNNFAQGCCKDVINCNGKVPREISKKTETFPRIINISSRGEVYVVVDSEDGTRRYFSGRLFNGSSINVKCDSPYKITSTNNDLIEVK